MIAGRLVLGAWLVVLWALLWGSVTPRVLLSGVVVAAGALVACRLPALPVAARPRPWKLVRAFGGFLVEVGASSIDIAVAAVREGPRTTGGIVAVPLRCRSDVVAMIVANRISATPGTLVIDVDRRGGVFYIYTVPLHRHEDADAARDQAERVGQELLYALGHEPDGQSGQDQPEQDRPAHQSRGKDV